MTAKDICGIHCYIYTADNKLLQVLRNPAGTESPLAVAFDSCAGTLAVAFGSAVNLFGPETAGAKVQWALKRTMQHDFVVRALSWSGTGQLLVAGSELELWETSRSDPEHPQWNRIWSCKLSSDVVKADFSPDGNFFATLCISDRLPKIWFQIETVGAAGHNYHFAYLPHPSTVTNFTWRRKAAPQKDVGENVLLTNCTDNISRLWCLLENIRPYRFHLGAVIDPITTKSSEEAPAGVNTHVGVVHWLSGQEVHDAITRRETEETRFSKKSKRKPGSTLLKSKKLKAALKDYSDVLFHVQSDGSVVFWGVQHLTGHPIQTPKLMMFAKADRALPLSDFDFFQQNSLVFHSDWETEDSAIFFPAEIQIVAHRQDGALNSYLMDLDDFFATSWMSPQLRLKHSWSGHRNPVTRVVRHPNLPFLASIGSDGEIIFYHSSVPMSGLRATDGLTAVTTIVGQLEEHDMKVTWLPLGLHFILFRTGVLSIHTLNGTSHTHIGDLKGYDSTYPLLFLHAYVDPNARILSGTKIEEHQSLIHVVGVSSRDSTAFVWALKFEGNVLQGHSMISKTSLLPDLHSEKQVTLLRALPTDDLCLIHYPQSPMGAHLFVTYSSDKLMRFWHCCDGCLSSLPDSSDWARDAMNQGDIQPWRVVGEFEYDADRLDHLETDAFGKICTVSSQPDNGSSVLTVWGNEATGLEMKREWTTTLNDTVLAVDWFFSSDGQHLLAVGMPNRAHMYCQRRLDSVEDNSTWDRIGDIEIAWPNILTTIAWLPTGSLMVATMETTLVYDKWMTEEDSTNALGGVRADTVPLQTFTVVDAKNGRLPDHHPQLLIQYLLWGKYDFVRYSLSLLHCFVKLMVDAGRDISETPVPLWRVFADDEPKGQREQQYDALFDFDDGSSQKELKVGEFSEEEAAYLSEQLTRTSLPNITNVNQMLLLAVIDTLVQVEKQKRSLDENGARYILFMRLFLFAQRSFPHQMKPKSLTSRDIAWGFFTDSQDILLDFVSQSFNNKVMWSDAKSLGMGYWLRNPDTMRKTMETIARNQYMGKDDCRNPVDCSLFYMALRKKNVVLGLWKLASSHPEQAAMLRFLANDFEEERWKAAALKNAFALLGKQRYEYAVAFFLLADKLKDAVSVCLKQLDDPQLATIICRLYEGEDGPILRETLTSLILPSAISKGDRWLASIAFTMLKQRENALFAILNPLEKLLDGGNEQLNPPDTQNLSDPALLVFYHYLRRSYRVQRVPQPRIPADVETDFVYRSAQAYERLGCPGLALDIIRKADALIGQYIGDEGTSGITELQAPPSDDVAAGNLDMDSWGEPVKKIDTDIHSSSGFNWGEPVSQRSESGPRKAEDFDWGEPVPPRRHEPSHAAGLDWSEPVANKPMISGGLDWGAPVSAQGGAGGIDWGEPVSTIVGKSALDDEFEAFKRSMGGYEEPDDIDPDGPPSTATSTVGEVMGPGHSVAEPPDPKRLLRFELEKRNMRLYKWMLGMRIVQAVYKSVSIISKNREVLKVESTFRDYFTLQIEGMRTLMSIIEMPVPVMDRILSTRCREMDAISAFLELAPLHDALQDYLPTVEKLLAEQCNALARLTLGDQRDREFAQPPAYVEGFARQLLLFVARWTERASESGCNLNESIACQTSATAFLTLTACALRRKEYQMLEQLVSLSDRFFDLLLARKTKNMTVMLLELSAPRAIQTVDLDAERDVDSGPDEEDFEDKSPLRDQLQAEVAIMCDSLVAVVSFQHIGLSFDGYLAQLRSSSAIHAEESHGFLCDAVLRPVSLWLRAMQKDLAKQWICGGVRTNKIRKYLDSSDKKLLWDTLRKTVSIPKMIEFVMQAQEDQPVTALPDQSDSVSESAEVSSETTCTPAEKSAELVYRTGDIIHTFAINPLEPNCMAIGTHRGIFEIDVERAAHFFQRRGTFSDIHHSVDDFAVRSTTTTAALKTESRISPLVLDNSREHILKRRDTLTRKLSFDSMQKAIQTNMQSLRTDASVTELDSGLGIHHTVTGVSSLASHSHLNHYLAGISDAEGKGIVQVYQFGQSRELVTYSSGTTARFTKTRFDPFGVRFGASDSQGSVFLWRFDASVEASRPAIVLSCHSSFTNDFTFLNSSTLLATAGVSTNNQNVCLWDTLLPTARARISAFNVAEGGAYSLAYSTRQQLLFSGSKKGDIYVFDVRQRKLLDSFQAHTNLVKALAIDYKHGALISGSMGGDVKRWDLQTFKEQNTWTASAASPVSPGNSNSPSSSAADKAGLSSYGIMQAEVIDDTVYTCGADGCVRRYPKVPGKP